MKVGSLIIYDNEGKIWAFIGDSEGAVLPHNPPVGLPYIITKYGELDGKVVKGVDVENKKLILEDIIRKESEEEKLRKEKEEVENLLLLKADKDLGGIL
ncbi:hypothetical protein FDF74_04585 [Clostridium niameyense]|uniref:Uncharacterized protein n=1 Tax=Clostridium niameyense TaxID=1622073 RepID=A0A6M0R8C6_9CLOT|nr:hypothetical protein [Clostridium niameyense]NEZ46492.1 hypothetical protein [Clostridium niameyense]